MYPNRRLTGQASGLVGVCMSVVGMGVGATVPVIMPVPVIMIMTMPVIISGRLFRELGKAAEGAIQLSGPAQEGDTGEHGDIEKLAGVVADGQPEQEVEATFGGGNGTPNQNGGKHEQQDAKVTTAAKDRKSFCPVDGQSPETDPRQQRQPGNGHIDQA